jgi:interleukin-1 receptor-associated kinase 1/coatomer subunit beta'
LHVNVSFLKFTSRELSLFGPADECDRYDWCTGYRIIKGICEGLKYLHKELNPPIYHLDLKPANVLLDKNMKPKMADFGMSRLLGDDKTRATKSSLGTL